MSAAVGSAAPDFRLPTTDGGDASLEDAAGAPAVVVAFWCNHCPYVRAWEERFNDIAREYSDRGVVTVAIGANDATTHPGDSFENMVVRAPSSATSSPTPATSPRRWRGPTAPSAPPRSSCSTADRRVAYHG